MKRLEDYTNKELSMLTDDNVENLIDVECMVAGVPLSTVPNPILREVPEIKKPSKEIFSVDSYSFKDKKEADSLAELLSSSISMVYTDYNYNAGGSNYKYYRDCNKTANVQKSYCYSKEEYDNLLDILKLKKDIEDYNTNVTKEYNDCISKRRDVVNTVWDKINEAKNRS